MKIASSGSLSERADTDRIAARLPLVLLELSDLFPSAAWRAWPNMLAEARLPGSPTSGPRSCCSTAISATVLNSSGSGTHQRYRSPSPATIDGNMYLAMEFRDAKKVFVTICKPSIMPSAHDRRIAQEPVRVPVWVRAQLVGLDPA